MLEPISEELRRGLMELRLCTPADLRRCRRTVRRLAGDLPAFDSVWLDALVQARNLTPFQARVLESASPQQLQVGSCVLIGRLGGGPTGSTYLARPVVNRQLCVIKLLERRPEEREQDLVRMQQLIRNTADKSHPHLVAPTSVQRSGNKLVVISRYVPGSHLKELLIRRGRFPAAVVWDIGRQLLDGLRTIELCGHSHGDVRLANVRLTAGGAAVLVDAGIQPALAPELTPHADLSSERYDGIAPELIGTGLACSRASDLYALGCLLWHLLAGRPPYTHGDPLAKLAAHQTRTIPDIREWAPDTPKVLAESILALTSRNPERRSAQAANLLRLWGPPRRSARRRIARFVASFEMPVHSGALGRATSGRWPWVALMLFALSGAALSMSDTARGPVLNVVSALPDLVRRQLGHSGADPADADEQSAETDSPQSTGGIARDGHLPLPAPDPNGLVLLDAEGPYASAEIAHVGRLVIRGKKGLRPQIVIDPKSMWLSAKEVRLENLTILAPGAAVGGKRENSLSALVVIEAQSLTIRDCSFETHADIETSAAPRPRSVELPAAIAWKVPHPEDLSGGDLNAENLACWGHGPVLAVKGPARKISLRNCLKLGPGPLLNLLREEAQPLRLAINLESVTCRQAGSLVRWQVPADPSTPAQSQLTIHADECVFDFEADRGALFELVGPAFQSGWLKRVQLIGAGSLIGSDVQVAIWHDGAQTPPAEITPAELQLISLEGLSSEALQFAGPPSRTAAESEIRETSGPRFSPELPGISAARLILPASRALSEAPKAPSR